MGILKGLHGSTGFWGLTHRGIRGIVHKSVGERQPSRSAEARADRIPSDREQMMIIRLWTTRGLRKTQVKQEAKGEVRDG